MSQIGFTFPNFRGENKKYLSCHHLEKVDGYIPPTEKFEMSISGWWLLLNGGGG